MVGDNRLMWSEGKENEMNKHILAAASAVCLTGCFGVSVEQCNQYAEQLRNSDDVVQVLKAYIGYRDGARTSRNSESIERSCWNDFLRRQDVNYTCLDKANTSDTCILYRRNHTEESELNFFDFKRFLPSDSKIKTEADFKMALDYYDTNTKACDKLAEKTVQEKQDCRDRVYNDVREFSKHGARSCRTVSNKEYSELLKKKGEWYKWAIDHDPWGFYKRWQATTGISLHGMEAVGMYERVYSKSEAIAEIKGDLETWGKEHLCDTSNYVNDLSRLGFDLD